jgi:hypothetical protein
MRSSMSNAGKPEQHSEDSGDSQSSGPSLVLLYTFVALALAVAIGCALLIVLPFYLRR